MQPSQNAHSVTGVLQDEKKTDSVSDKQVGVSGRHRADEQWRPAEFKRGAAKFKDPGVYLDGVPVGVLRFGELPIPLEPVWLEKKAGVPYRKGQAGGPYRMVKQRHYRFVDYFRAVGVPVDKLQEMHIYGGNRRARAIVITGKELRSKELLFRFSSRVRGKVLPRCPSDLQDGLCPDHLKAVALYIRKKPPSRVEGGFQQDGKWIHGIPYYGDPLRGGVRVYLDGPLKATIKRNKLLDETLRVSKEDGTIHWKLFGVLESLGVKTSHVKEAWVIHKDKRTQKLDREFLLSATFVASSQGKGQILLGPDKIPTQALALHSKPIRVRDLPVLTAREKLHAR